MMGYQMGGRSRGFDMVGSVSTLPNLALGIVGGPNTKRPPKLEYAKPPTEPTGICVTAGRTGSEG